MSNRFELEQEILTCWNIIEDLRACPTSDDYIDALVVVYSVKFDKLWRTFEMMLEADPQIQKARKAARKKGLI